MNLNELIPVLQVATGPVILISGVGLLLLTMTNRLGRTIDRARQLAREVNSPDANRTHVAEQVATIYRRARVLRTQQNSPPRVQRAGRDRDQGEIVHEGPRQILPDHQADAAAEQDRLGERGQIGV